MSGPHNALSAADPDAIARAQGFPSYAAMVAWRQHRQDSLRVNNTTTEGGPSAPAGPPPQAPANQTERSWFQTLMHAFGAAGY